MRPYLALLIGVTGISFAAIFIRLADAPVLVIAASRLAIASLLLAPPVLLLRWPGQAALSIAALRLPLLAGVLMALHFVLWIASLQLTSVASSVILVTAHPIFVALVAPLVTGDRLSRQVMVYVSLGTLGAALIGVGDAAFTGEALVGDLLALGGGLMAGGFLLVGRRARQRVPLPFYLLVAYGTAATLLIVAVFALRLPILGYSAQTYLMLLLLALVPQLIGHSAINWALRHLSTTVVATGILGEPIGATLLAFLFLGETPPATSLAGGGVVLAAVYLAFREEQRVAASAP